MTIPGIYSQRDSRWANNELGYNGDPYYNMYHFGCLVTAVANMLWWNGNSSASPGAVNQWLKDAGGFEAGGGNMIWSAITPLLEQVNMVARGYTTDVNALNAFLADENAYAIVQLTKPGFPMHFSAMPYVSKIADSWDAVLKPLNSYTFLGAHLYSKNAQIVPPAPAPQPVAPAAPTIIAPIPVPVPDPVPSETNPVPDPEPTGQTNGEVTVHPATAPDSVLQDAPPMPEYQETFTAFSGVSKGPNDVIPGREVHLKEDGMAIDLTGAGAPKSLLADRPFRSSGTCTESGKRYYRGTGGGWYAVPADNVQEEVDIAGGYANFNPPPPPAGPAVPTLWAQIIAALHDPIGALIRLIARSRS